MKQGLRSSLVILEECNTTDWRARERYWTERLIKAGHGPTNCKRASFDAQRREERAMREALRAGRELAASL